MKFRICLAHLAPVVLLVFTIHEISLSSIHFSPKTMFLLQVSMGISEILEMSPKFKFFLRCNIMLHLCTVIYAVSGLFSLYIHYLILPYPCTIKAVQGNCAKISTIGSIVHNIFALYISCHSYTFLKSTVLIRVGINHALVK